MATTTSSDVKIYQNQFQGAFIETLTQNVDAFNAASRGAIALSTGQKKGQYEYEAMMQEVSSIARRDPSAESSSTVSSTKLTQDEYIRVKLHRRNGPYEFNHSAAFLAGFDPSRFSITIGEQAAVAVPKEMLNTSIGAVEAKLDSISALNYETASATMTTAALANGLSKFGDQAERIICWVMHSKVYWDLVIAQLAQTATVFGTEPFGTKIAQGMPVTLNRPVLVTDSASLISYSDVSTGDPQYSTLGLVAGAVQCELTEAPLAVLHGPLTGSENIYSRYQAEYGYNLGLKGCKYAVAAGANPTAAVLATADAWTTVAASNKDMPGILIKTR